MDREQVRLEKRVDRYRDKRKVSISSNRSAQSIMMRSTVWLTIGNITSRVLGALYVIPWYKWMGENAHGAQYLFSKGYNIYALFLMISTAGIPAAIAKQTANYNSLEDYASSRRLLKQAIIVMTFLGIITMITMFTFSGRFAQGNKDLSSVIKFLSWVLLIFPAMSVLRGFFQGNNDLMPYAISQILEQIIRVGFMLVVTYYIMIVSNNKDYRLAVILSTFAAFVGVFSSLVILIYFFIKKKHTFFIADNAEKLAIATNNESTSILIKNMILQAIPFIFIGCGISIFKLIDQFFFEKIMVEVTDYSIIRIKDIFTLLSPNPDKLVMVIISLGTSMATAGLPLITEKFIKKEIDSLKDLIINNIGLFFFVMTPATIGMILISEPLNTLFYEKSEQGTHLLALNCVLGIAMGLFLVCATMLQGLNGNFKAVLYLLLGIITKILTQYPLIYFLHEDGAILSSLLGFTIINLFTIYEIYIRTKFNILSSLKLITRIIVISIGMGILLKLIKIMLMKNLDITFKSQSFYCILIMVVVGVLYYLLVTVKIGLFQKIFIRRSLK
ncbi:putative polysaccharide biosynthesis protein [Enterococcus sp. CSURQ0835]|uniref:putative polysaccharide biosynthesis protein n=1 Tax=Enterococcus sp. CSURQ0835 TaxID=2681394 RepID=UPI0013580E8B|nr:polysaccharide biosynthesis protein [Enterococcus sp. CSURQ0835]